MPLVKRSNFLIFIIQISAFVIEIMTFNMDSTTELSTAFFAFAINIILQLVYFIKNRGVFSLGFFFIMFSYLFQVSFLILLYFDIVPSNSAIYTVHLYNHGYQSFIEATRYGIKSIAMFFLGYIFFDKAGYINKAESGVIDENIFKKRQCVLYGIGKIFSILFMPLYGLVTVIQVYIVMKSGSYIELFNVGGFLNKLRILQIFYFVGLFALILYHKHDRNIKKANLIFYFSIICASIQFFTGARSIPMVIILTGVLFWGKFVNEDKIKKSTVIMGIIMAFVLLQFLYAIRTIRENNFSFDNFLIAFFSMKNNLVYETLSEFGTSVFCTSAFMNNGDVWHPVDFVIKEIGSILPSISSWGGKLFDAPTVITGIEKTYSIGTTYIADYYYYFGKYGCYIVALLGAWVSFWDNKIQCYKKCGDNINVLTMFVFSYFMLNTVRANESYNLKMLLYSFIILWFAKTIVKCIGR